MPRRNQAHLQGLLATKLAYWSGHLQLEAEALALCREIIRSRV